MNSRKKKKAKVANPIEGKFVPILEDEMDSKAYTALNGNAAKLYNYLKRAARTVAYIAKTRESEVQFDFTYKEAKRHGFSESTFIRAIKELWATGFIDIVERGGLRGQGRTNSHYKLTNLWKTYGHNWIERAKFQQNPFINTSEPKCGSEKW